MTTWLTLCANIKKFMQWQLHQCMFYSFALGACVRVINDTKLDLFIHFYWNLSANFITITRSKLCECHLIRINRIKFGSIWFRFSLNLRTKLIYFTVYFNSLFHVVFIFYHNHNHNFSYYFFIIINLLNSIWKIENCIGFFCFNLFIFCFYIFLI